MLWAIVVVLIVLALVGAPNMGVWQHSYGYGPSGFIGVIVIVLIVLLLMGRL
jgi:hypothetical protein